MQYVYYSNKSIVYNIIYFTSSQPNSLGNSKEKTPKPCQQVSSLQGNLIMHKPYRKLLIYNYKYNNKNNIYLLQLQCQITSQILVNFMYVKLARHIQLEITNQERRWLKIKSSIYTSIGQLETSLIYNDEVHTHTIAFPKASTILYLSKTLARKNQENPSLHQENLAYMHHTSMSFKERHLLFFSKYNLGFYLKT